jgi:hypothetical protein
MQVKLPDGPWVFSVSSGYFAMHFWFCALIALPTVNGMGFGMGRGPTINEAKEDAARRGLDCLRVYFGVKEGVMTERIERDKHFERNKPPKPSTLTIELVPE